MSGVRVPLRPCSELARARVADPARHVGVPLVNALEVTTVKVSHRFALSAAGLAAALAVSAAPSVAGAQVSGRARAGHEAGPRHGVPRRLEGGVKLADEIRNRVTSDFNIRTLMPVSKKDIDNTLVSSGYRPDSALSPNDIKELREARSRRRDDRRHRDEDRRRVPRQRAPLPAARRRALAAAASAPRRTNLGDMAKQIVREYDQARKQIPANAGVRERHPRAEGRRRPSRRRARASRTYPKATIARLCLASAYQAWKTGPRFDQQARGRIRSSPSTNAITALDKRARSPISCSTTSYKAKNDAAEADGGAGRA